MSTPSVASARSELLSGGYAPRPGAAEAGTSSASVDDIKAKYGYKKRQEAGVSTTSQHCGAVTGGSLPACVLLPVHACMWGSQAHITCT